jgi:hypothetical protein
MAVEITKGVKNEGEYSTRAPMQNATAAAEVKTPRRRQERSVISGIASDMTHLRHIDEPGRL